MIRYKPTRITIGENDIHESLERMLLRHTRFAEWHEHDTDQSDIENNADATSVDSDSFPPYAFSHFGGSNCERESDSLFHEGLSHGSWRRNDGHFPVLPSNEEHRSSLSAGPQWGHGINLSQLTSAAVSGLGSLDPVHGYRSFVETDPPVLSGAESLLKDIHLQSSVKPLVACCAEQLYHSLRAHLLFSALPRNSLTRWENTINTPYERVKKFFTSPENRTAQRSPLHSHPQRDTNFLDFTLPAVFSAYTILANGIYHLEEGNTSDNTGLALILPNSEKANIDTKLREEKFSLKQVVSFSQALDFCSSICSDKGAHFQTSPMTEPARKILKATEGSQADSSFSSQIGRTQLKARRRSIDYDSDTESHVSEVELPHKPHQVATLTISSENGAARGSERESSSSLSDIPSMEDPTFDDLSADGERQNEDSEDGTNGSIDIQISSPERDQHDSPYLHSHGDTTEEESSPKSKLSTIQASDGIVAKPNAQMYSQEELEQIGAVLYREADAALRGLVVNPMEDTDAAAGRDSTASTNPTRHGGRDSTRGPQAVHSEPAGNEREQVHPVIRASAEFQNRVNNMMAEFYHQREDKVDDFGLAMLRRKPLGEWYT